MEVTVDKFGRIVVPKLLRNRLGLEPGQRLSIEQVGQEIRLRLLTETPELRDEGGVLVYYGRVTGDLDETLKHVREQRQHRIGG